MRLFLAALLTFLISMGCASNSREHPPGWSKGHSHRKHSVAGRSAKKQSKPGTFTNENPARSPRFGSRLSGQKTLLPTLASEKDGSLMVLVQSGEERLSVLNPSRGVIRPDAPASGSINLPAFYMDRLEITVQQYKKYDSRYDEKPFTGDRECPDCPAMAIDWANARSYCHWAGKRLPTESEWTLAAGGGTGTIWPWGNEFSADKANLIGDGDGSLAVAATGTHPQGASPFGLMDMAGNVWEWVSDPHPVSGNTNSNNTLRIIKGGGWTSDPREARISSRIGIAPDKNNPTVGFRCAKSLAR